MEQILLLGLILVVFLVPSFLQMRRQQKQLGDIKAVQQSLKIGDVVITSSGLHGTVVALRPTEADLEVAPGVTTTWERMSIVRRDQSNAQSEQSSQPHTEPGDQAENDSA